MDGGGAVAGAVEDRRSQMKIIYFFLKGGVCCMHDVVAIPHITLFWRA